MREASYPFISDGVPNTPTVRGLPYKKRQSFEILPKLWNDVRDGGILICSSMSVADFDAIISTPSTLVTEKFPDRTLPTEMRLISDVRRVRNFCDKTDYPTCLNPSLADIARRVECMDRNFPGVFRRVTKRDVNDASKRVATPPDCASILRTEFPGSDSGLPEDIIVFWSALPFGLSASPGYFQSCAKLITKLRCAHLHVSPLVGAIPFASHMFVDDAMIVDVMFPKRLEHTATAWEQCCCTVLGMNSVSEKKKIEGEWAEAEILLGFHVNVQTKRIRLPDANIEGAWATISKPAFNAGNTVILLNVLQAMRGLFAHYSNCNQVCGTFAIPIDALLAYPDKSSLRVRCADSELWHAFWNVIASPRQILSKVKGRKSLFEGSLLDLLPERVRLSGPAIRGRVFWFSGDATLTRVSCINWSEREFIRFPISDLLVLFFLDIIKASLSQILNCSPS